MSTPSLWIPESARAGQEHFQKSPAPKTGPQHGAWSGRDLTYLNFPGGGALAFDLSKLTLTDYRTMRTHYQVNASSCILNFMLHQMDWEIKCDEARIARKIDDIMRPIWTRLNRGMGQALWAGYSPQVIEWDNDGPSKSIIITKIKDLIPEECHVNWKEVDGARATPTTAPVKLYEYDGIAQGSFGFNGASAQVIEPQYCVTPDTPVLCSDFTWRPAGELLPGDEIISFDEEDTSVDRSNGRPLLGRKYRTAEIVVNQPIVKKCVTVSTDIGDDVTSSVDHPFLVRVPNGKKSKDCWEWKIAEDLIPGDRIAFFGRPWEFDESREAGWLAGMFDGEGSLSRGTNDGGTSKARSGIQPAILAISQNEGGVLDRLKASLGERGFDYSLTRNQRDTCAELVIRGGRREVMRFLGMMKPGRFMERDLSFLWENVSLKLNKSVGAAVVTEVKNVGDSTVASIQTSNGTFITAGYLTHNTLWYPTMMENGDYYGRKLLKPAFVPWFFSQLIHLFTNRYYERFGEPTPIGRADFDDEVIDADGNAINGRVAMENILMNLRNRGVVVLPSARNPVGNGTSSEYAFDIEYLESQMRGVEWERYLFRLDEEISLGMFTPLSAMRIGEHGAMNQIQVHMQVYLWMLNAFAGDWKEYIDRYVVDRIKEFNFGPNAPKAEWIPKKFGKDNAETLRAIVTAGMSNGGLKPDAHELGEAIGLTMEEVKVLTAPQPGAPGAPGAPAVPGGAAAAVAGAKPKDPRISRGTHQDRQVPKTGDSGVIRHKMSERVWRQFQKAKFDGAEMFTPDIGFQRQLEDHLGSAEEAQRCLRTFTAWATDAYPLTESGEEFRAMFEKVVEGHLD